MSNKKLPNVSIVVPSEFSGNERPYFKVYVKETAEIDQLLSLKGLKTQDIEFDYINLFDLMDKGEDEAEAHVEVEEEEHNEPVDPEHPPSDHEHDDDEDYDEEGEEEAHEDGDEKKEETKEN